MKRGFTLIELLGVLVIIGILVMIAMPSINKAIQDTKQENYKLQLSQIELAAKSWALDNLISVIADGETATITLAQLKVSGYIGKDIRNSINQEYLPNDMEILITRKGLSSSIQILENTGSDVDEFNEDIIVFVLYGKTVETVELNNPYVENGILFTDALGTELTNTTEVKYGDTVVAEIDESVLGKYTVTYTTTTATNVSKVIKTVTVQDTLQPEISIPGPIEIYIDEIGTLDLETGVTVSDNSLETIQFTIVGTVEPQIGTYAIKYRAVDSSGNVALKSRLVKIMER